jgi:hypothetical protein
MGWPGGVSKGDFYDTRSRLNSEDPADKVAPPKVDPESLTPENVIELTDWKSADSVIHFTKTLARFLVSGKIEDKMASRLIQICKLAIKAYELKAKSHGMTALTAAAKRERYGLVAAIDAIKGNGVAGLDAKVSGGMDLAELDASIKKDIK